MFEPGSVTTDEAAASSLHAAFAAVHSWQRCAAHAARWSAESRRAALEQTDRLAPALAAARSAPLLAEREAGTWAGHGDRSFAAWVGRTTRSGEREAVLQVAQADALTTMPTVAAAIGSGVLGSGHLDVLARLSSIASDVVVARLESDQGQAEVLELGRRVDAGEYRRALAAWAAAVDPDHVQRTHDEQHTRRYLHLTATPGGTLLKGLLDASAGSRLRLALDAVSPAPAADDERTGEQRRADALLTIAERVLSMPETTPGAVVRPHVSVVLSEVTWTALAAARRASPSPGRAPEECPGGSAEPEGLTGSRTGTASPLGAALEALCGVPAPADEDGVPVPAGEVLRVLCDCELTRVVLDAEGSPIDLGRTRRLYSGPQRRAVIARGGGCGWPGCSSPARYGEVHLIAWWDRDGGSTDLRNAVILCGFHHHQVHQQDLTVVRIAHAAAPPGARARAGYRFLRRDGTVLAGAPGGRGATEATPSRAPVSAAPGRPSRALRHGTVPPTSSSSRHRTVPPGAAGARPPREGVLSSWGAPRFGSSGDPPF